MRMQKSSFSNRCHSRMDYAGQSRVSVRMRLLRTLCTCPILSCGGLLFGMHSSATAVAQEWTTSHVVRSITTITVENEKKLVVSKEEELVITDETWKHLGYAGVRETDFINLRRMDATVYDVNGDRVVELEKSDLKTSSVSYEAVYNEHKTTYHELSYHQLPYRIHKRTEYELRSLFFLPDWNAQNVVEVDYAEFTIILKAPLEFDYVSVGDVGEPRKYVNEDGRTCYSWTVSDVPAMTEEYRQAPESAMRIGVRTMPRQFDLDGFVGSNDSWSSLGLWYYDMIKDRLEFSDRFDMLDSAMRIEDTQTRIRHIYEYLQDNTRYAQIYMGVDGWRPHKVSSIHKTRYGDCKDLSMYTIAMLDRVGIEAYPALALTRDVGVVDPGFPGAKRFNHCIAVVPGPTDTLWLECTSNVTPFNDPPARLEGTSVRVVTSEGGQLARIPVSSASSNSRDMVAHAALGLDRSLSISGTVSYTGNRAMAIRGALTTMDTDNRKRWFRGQFAAEVGEVKLMSLEVRNLSKRDTALIIDYTAVLPYYARKAGPRLIITPVLFADVTFSGEAPELRTRPLLNMTTFASRQTVHIALPDGFAYHNTAADEHVTSRFGELRVVTEPAEDTLIWTSSFRMDARYISLDDYSEYYTYMNRVQDELDKRVVLRK